MADKKRLAAYHQAGHAVMAHIMFGEKHKQRDFLDKVSIDGYETGKLDFALKPEHIDGVGGVHYLGGWDDYLRVAIAGLVAEEHATGRESAISEGQMEEEVKRHLGGVESKLSQDKLSQETTVGKRCWGWISMVRETLREHERAVRTLAGRLEDSEELRRYDVKEAVESSRQSEEPGN